MSIIPSSTDNHQTSVHAVEVPGYIDRMLGKVADALLTGDVDRLRVLRRVASVKAAASRGVEKRADWLAMQGEIDACVQYLLSSRRADA